MTLTVDFSTLEAIRIALGCGDTKDDLDEWDENIRLYMTRNHPEVQLQVNRRRLRTSRYPGRLSQWTVRGQGRRVRVRGVVTGGSLIELDVDVDLCAFLEFAGCNFVDVGTMPRLQQIIGIPPTIFYPALKAYFDALLEGATLQIDPALETLRQYTLAHSRSQSVVSVIGTVPENARFIDASLFLCDYIEQVDLNVEAELLSSDEDERDMLDRMFLDRIDAEREADEF
jgi:hypothetical protein